MRTIRIFFLMMAANLRGMMSLKVDFLVTFFAGLFSQTIGLLFLGVLFQNIPAIAGWTAFEVAVLYGYMFFGEGIMTLFFQGTNGLWRQARKGVIDRYMTRPLSLSLQICGSQINLAGAGTVLTGLAVMFYSFHRISVDWDFWKAVMFAISLFLGTVIRVNINYGSSALGMCLDGGGIKGAVEKMQDMGKYPLDIYPKAFRVILLSLIPYAAITYVPAAVILDKQPMPYFLLLPAAAFLSSTMRKFIMKKAMEHYDGAGN